FQPNPLSATADLQTLAPRCQPPQETCSEHIHGQRKTALLCSLGCAAVIVMTVRHNRESLVVGRGFHDLDRRIPHRVMMCGIAVPGRTLQSCQCLLLVTACGDSETHAFSLRALVMMSPAFSAPEVLPSDDWA